MIAKFFIERPIFANVIAVLTIILGLVALGQAAGRAIPQHRAADRAGHRALSRRQRFDGRARRGAAHRAEGQRRRRHDLHVVDEHERRHLHAHGDLQDRHRRRQGADPGAEPGQQRAAGAALGRADPGRADRQALDLDPRDRGAELATAATTACSCRTMPPSIWSTSSPASTASAASRCSGRANTPCGSGSIPRRCRRASWCLPTSSTPSICRAAAPEPGSSACRPSPPARPSNTRSTCRASSTTSPSSRTSSSRRIRRDGRITRLRDVATVELGAQQYSQTFKLNGQPSAGIAIFQLPEANALDVAKRVETAHGRAAEGVPARDDAGTCPSTPPSSSAPPSTRSTRR